MTGHGRTTQVISTKSPSTKAENDGAFARKMTDGSVVNARVLRATPGRVFDRGSPDELIKRFGREDMEEVFLDMARGRGRGLDALRKAGAAP